MLDAVAAAAEEMTGAAVLSAGPLDAHGDTAPIRRVVGFLVSGKHHFFCGGVSCSRRKFFIGSGLLVTDEAVARAIQQIEAFHENGRFNHRQYQRLLAANRMTPEIFEENMRTELMVDKIQGFVLGGTKVSDAEALETFRWRKSR